MLRLATSEAGFAKAFARLVADRRESDDDVARDVSLILGEVRQRGDDALAEYTARFDHLQELTGRLADKVVEGRAAAAQ